jgi:replicative DNA helicase
MTDDTLTTKQIQAMNINELEILAIIMNREESFEEVYSKIGVEDFLFEETKSIFLIMEQLYKDNSPINPVTIFEKSIALKKQLDLIRLFDIYQNCATTNERTLNHYIDYQREQSTRRKAIDFSKRLLHLSENYELFDSVDLFLETVENELQKIQLFVNNKELISNMSDSIHSFLTRIQLKNKHIKTGRKAFDSKMGGFGRGWLYVLSARTGVGKTARALQYTLDVLYNNPDITVLFFSQEMKKSELIMRLVSNIVSIPIGLLFRNEGLEKFKNKIDEAVEQLEKLNLFIYDIGDINIAKITSIVNTMSKKYNVGLVVIDYLQILDIKQAKHETRSSVIGNVTRKAKALAMKNDCCVLLLSQLSRPKEKADEIPQLHHLRDSGEIEQDADVVEFLVGKDETEEGQNVLSVIAKGRETGIGEFSLCFKKWFQRFEEKTI